MKLRTFIRTLVISFVGLMCLLVVGFEWSHYHTYGHLVSYGLHVDSLNRDAYIGIPGQTKMYSARLSNFTLWPVSLPACDYVSDVFGKGTEFPYAVQRWDSVSNSWQTVSNMSGDGFCQITPLSEIGAELVYR